LDLFAFPNPATDRIAVQLGDIQSKAANIILFNSAGHKMLEESVKLYRGEGKITLEIDHLPRGIYHLQLQAENQLKSKQIILQ